MSTFRKLEKRIIEEIPELRATPGFSWVRLYPGFWQRRQAHWVWRANLPNGRLIGSTESATRLLRSSKITIHETTGGTEVVSDE